jgi:hypothetical protein
MSLILKSSKTKQYTKEDGVKILQSLSNAAYDPSNDSLKEKFEEIMKEFVGCKYQEIKGKDPIDNFFDHFRDKPGMYEAMELAYGKSISELITDFKGRKEIVDFLKNINLVGTCTLLTSSKTLVFDSLIKLQNLEKYNEYYKLLFEYIIKFSDDKSILEETFKILINNYYLGKDCDYLNYDIKKNIRLLSIVSFIRNNINNSYLMYEYHYLIHIIELQFDMLEKFCKGKSGFDENMPPPPGSTATITLGPGGGPKWCIAIAMKYPISLRINSLIWSLFSTVSSLSGGGKFEDLMELRASNPIEFEKQVLTISESESKYLISHTLMILDKFEIYGSASGDSFHLRNLELQTNGFTRKALEQQFKGKGKSPYNSLKTAMEQSLKTQQNDASFNAHYGIASHMIESFDDIKSDLQKIGITINLDDSNIVFQLISLCSRFENTDHPINHPIPIPVKVPC